MPAKNEAQPTKPEQEEVERKKLPLAGIQPGHLMAMTYWGLVTHVGTAGRDPVITLRHCDGTDDVFSVRGLALIEQGLSADWADGEEVLLSQSELAELFITLTGRPLTVTFTKQDGSQRILKGRIIRASGALGDSLVEDLELPAAQRRIRTVIHRQIDAITVDGVRYRLKTKRT